MAFLLLHNYTDFIEIHVKKLFLLGFYLCNKSNPDTTQGPNMEAMTTSSGTAAV